IELLCNLVEYAAFLILVFLILGALGVNTAEILAGLGILALILGLGVTSLIEDIVAGIFIIFEKTFDVNDIIVVDGFRGTVVSIGIRSTKLADVGGDILTLRNSSIGSVINLTDRLSCAALSIPLAPQESLERAEALIKSINMESISAKYPKVMEGAPIYLGLCDITKKGLQMLLFICPCQEANRYDVERGLYHELKFIFESNGIQLGAPGIEE
ncbi:MAG: mechanosensitive ion channel, partial [Clostridia bacterium]|nr:mechanosensitive ion channel [Clostridia bacterium]